ncbi:hypothetical protein CTAYLR_001454 [Chrysophaeum taylorii]|uniref:PPM-type phosphatase domain-containing protein n=1 Tax=Chrysophaeum taylorii TaxID=2483200 RepID=A0AAD7UB54_9STRA|nr:hypothetical protein CTAYLR_001454 [Chrysophaeum taylorii]
MYVQRTSSSRQPSSRWSSRRCSPIDRPDRPRARPAGRPGWRSSQQDAYVVSRLVGRTILAVFDGHGGAEVSRHAANSFIPRLEAELSENSPAEALRRALAAIESSLREELSGISLDQVGSTAICVAVDDATIACSWLGDSRAVLSSNGVAVPLSYDHRPDDDLERQRISNAGARVFRGRVNGMLAVSRALGDYLYKSVQNVDAFDQPVSAKPDCVSRPRSLDATDEFVIVACDGIWEKVTNDQAVAFVRAAWAHGLKHPDLVVTKLLQWCLLSGSTDNMTCCLYLIDTTSLDDINPQDADARLQATDLAAPAVFFADQVIERRRANVAKMAEADVVNAIKAFGLHSHAATLAAHHVDGESLLEVEEHEFTEDLEMPPADARFMTLALQWWDKTSTWL